MKLNLGSIVEGHGETRAVPVLLRRLHQEMNPRLQLELGRPIRSGRYKLVKEGKLERTIELAARQLARPRAILILIHAEDDCPAQLAPVLLERARKARPDVPTGIVLATREYEAWFLACLDKLSGRRGLGGELAAIDHPESLRDAKGIITRHMVGSRAYSETLDQPALTALLNIQAARRRSASFDKCCREVERLFLAAGE